MLFRDHFKEKFTLSTECFPNIKGQNRIKKGLKSALLMNRHTLIIGPPGIGKTTLAKSIAELLPDMELNRCSYHCSPENPVCPECKTHEQEKTTVKGIERFVRVQGSPDLTAEDLIGDIDPGKALKHGPLSIEAFTPGKIFKANNGVLFFDELNRCPEKLQNSLLQVLQERRATIGSYDLDIEANFIFIATMNPHDASTEKLSDVLMDRFDVIYMNYPESLDIEKAIVIEYGEKMIEFPDGLMNWTVNFVRELRNNPNLEKVPSVRATLGLYERAQSNAFLEKKDRVSLDNIKDAIESVISHRISLKPSIEYLQTPQEFLKKEMERFERENAQEGARGGST